MGTKMAILAVMTMVVLLGAACPAPVAAEPGAEGVITVRCFFSVDGFGSFMAGPYNTGAGYSSGWFGAGTSISLSASAAPGWKFSHWTFNGNFGGSSPQASVPARPGLQIKAIFEKI